MVCLVFDCACRATPAQARETAKTCCGHSEFRHGTAQQRAQYSAEARKLREAEALAQEQQLELARLGLLSHLFVFDYSRSQVKGN